MPLVLVFIILVVIAFIGIGKAIGIIVTIGAAGYLFSALRRHAWLEAFIAFCLLSFFLKGFH